ncbi:hypothetical protein LSTR_LSTR014829 [Laodelphax striatellus]|uniref:Uncharacterized protein n=1 Tax=Laodelphax striatellus TaxID=195883 RepID=A0A482WPM4_LAOST|nr:hypothetical protein LSTR_LSTR014829 [Laodelphax striatellus]
MSTRDLTVLIGGTNDFSRNSQEGYLRTVESQLQKLTHTRVFLVNVPCRYDLPLSSPVNVAISEANGRLKELVRLYKNVELFNVHGLGRRFYTQHGLHINLIGKLIIADKIVQCFQSDHVVDNHCSIPIPDVSTINEVITSECPQYQDDYSYGSVTNSIISEGDTVMDVSTKSRSTNEEIPVMMKGNRSTYNNFLENRLGVTGII